MAQVPKVYAPTSAQVTAASKTLPSSRVASLDSLIDQTNEGNPTSNLDTTPFTLEGGPQQHSTGNQRRHHPPVRHSALLVVPSQLFSSLVEIYSNEISSETKLESRERRLGRNPRHIIQVYETNSRIIHGEAEVTGTEISLTL